MKLIFDLDGTLSDPAAGIVNAYNYALSKHQLDSVSPQILKTMIGPPLDIAFNRLIPDLQESDVQSLVESFRQYYGETGYAENVLYEGIPEMLEGLATRNFTLGVCTSKRADFADRILKMFGIRDFFEFLNGGDVGISKVTQLATLLEEERAGTGDMMVGDRENDVNAAKANGLLSMAVLWGYGSYVELKNSGADFFVPHVPDLVDCIDDITRKD